MNDALQAQNDPQISIHSPRMGRDGKESDTPQGGIISIHSPRMGRDVINTSDWQDVTISIHSPRMGRDYTRSPARTAAR